MSDEFTFDMDMEDVESYGRLMPNGYYKVKVKDFEVNRQEDKADKYPYVSFNYVVTEGPFEGNTIDRDIVSLSPNAKGIFQQWAEALTGMSWRKNGMKFNPNEFVGLECVVLAEEKSVPRRDGTGYFKKMEITNFLPKSTDISKMTPPAQNLGPNGGNSTAPAPNQTVDLGF